MGPTGVRRSRANHGASRFRPRRSRPLRRYRKDQAERLLAVGVRQDEDTFIVTDGFGEQVRPNALSKAFRRFSAEHGFDLPRYHGLRHTAAILMLVSGPT